MLSNLLFNIVSSQVLHHYAGHSRVTFIIILEEDIGLSRKMGFLEIKNISSTFLAIFIIVRFLIIF